VVELAVELREITSETVRTICELDVADGQRPFVAPNAVSIAEAHFEPAHWMRAIYAGGEPAGFVMLYENAAKGEYFVWRLMVAAGFQRRGIGRRTMELLLERWRELGVPEAGLCVVPSNHDARALYESLGFRLTGEVEDGELVMRMPLRRDPS
jgi:diamine N-acetyltransferase